MRRSFSRAFDPPAPVLPIRVRAPSGLDVTTLDGKLDTGADLCAVPGPLVAELDLPPVRTVRAAGFLGTPQEAIVYRMDLEIDGMSFPRVEVLATRRSYAIIGRNVLRRLVVRLDGPRAQLEVRLPKPRS